MAIANHINGQFIGKIGNTVSYMLRGKYVCRSIGKYHGKPSDKQLANFMAMKVSMAFLKVIKGFIDVGFGLEALGTDKSAFNLATSYVKKMAIKGNYPNLSIDYSKVVLSKGTVPLADETSIMKAENGVLIKWSTDPKPDKSRRDDSTMILLYFPKRKVTSFTLNATKRTEGSYFIELSKPYLNEPIEAYICFKQADGKAVSDSMYIGNVNGELETEEEIANKKTYLETKQRFDGLEASYKERIKRNYSVEPEDKSFRILKKEYEVLKEKLENMPGKGLS